MRFSVIMPVYLESYQTSSIKSASNPEYKFVRAVDSFLKQSFTDAELIIVADGCKKARLLYLKKFINGCYNIRFKYIDKQPMFSGVVRQTGIEMAKGDVICYLDSDDYFGRLHLEIINSNFDTDLFSWVYYDDILIKSEDLTVTEVRNVRPVHASIGTSSIAHKRSLNVQWGDGYGHDIRMIEKYLFPHPYSKIKMPQYCVCHCAGKNMDF